MEMDFPVNNDINLRNVDLTEMWDPLFYRNVIDLWIPILNRNLYVSSDVEIK